MANIIIESEKQIVKKNDIALFDFISDFKNFKALLPEDRISDYTCDTDWCNFTITGLTSIRLVTEQKISPSLIKVKSENVRNIEIEISIHLKKLEDVGTEGIVILEADTNAFLKIMIEQPLKNLANMIAKKMHDLPI